MNSHSHISGHTYHNINCI